MNAAGIISYARRLCGGVSESQINPDNMLIILNKSYKDLYKRVVNLDKNYFWDRWTADIVEDQYEYSMLSPVAGTYGIFKPEKLRIKYNEDWDYKDIEFKDWDNLTETPEWYAKNQSKETPIAIITDNKYVHIFPTPTEDVTDGLLIEGAKQPYNLLIDSDEDEILIDPMYHEVLSYMMCPGIYKEMGLVDKKNDSLNEAEVEIQKAFKSMGILTTKVIRCKRPDLSIFD